MKRMLLLSSLILGTLAGQALASESMASAGCSTLPRTSAARKNAATKSAFGPTVTNVEFFQVPKSSGTGSRVVVTYDLASPSGPCTVSLRVSDNGGVTYDIVPQTVTGAVGANVPAGTGKQIEWDITADLPNTHIAQASVQIIADDGTCTGCKLWSDPTTWSPNPPPASGDTVTIAPGQHVILDVDPPALAALRVEGTLEFARRDTQLQAGYILVQEGTFRVGEAHDPFTHRATITLTGGSTEPGVPSMGTRGILVMGGSLELHGTSPAIAWSKINAHAPAGTTSFTMMEPLPWSAGDQVIIAPTDFHTVTPNAFRGVTERLTLAGVAGSTLTTTTPLANARWGRLQYATNSGMSETPPVPGSPDEIVLGPGMEQTPLVLDQRAAVGNLTRNIVVQAPDDTDWQTNGFGAHIMVMGPDSAAYVDGVEIRRGGQRDRLGRYPFHWHMLSYNPPAEIGDATGQYFRNSVVHESMNRGIVIHGTNGVLVDNNIVYHVRGHGIFTEDAVERRNTITNNLVLRVLNPEPEDALKLHELENGTSGTEGGASGFWVSNPDNTITGNLAADCQGMGFWLAFTFQAWGESISVPIAPRFIKLREFSHNTAHSNRWRGILIDLTEGNNEGNVGFPLDRQQYLPTDDYDGIGPGSGYENRVHFELTDLSLWKNGKNGIWDRASGPQNRRIVSADNCLKFFSGSGSEGLIENCLVVGTSLNNPTARPNHAGDEAPTGFATYHSGFSIQRNVVLNFPLYPGQTSGAFAEDDFYIRPVEKGTVRNSGNILINSHPGYKSRATRAGELSFWVYYPQAFPGQFYQFQPFGSWFAFAPAKWDPFGLAGPAGNYVVYNSLFHTHELTVTPVTPDTLATPQNTWGQATGSVSVPGPFYGFVAFQLHGDNGAATVLPQNRDFEDNMPIEVRRYDLQDLSYIDTWSLSGTPTPPGAYNLAHMRHFAAHRDGVYQLDFPFNDYHPGWNQAPIYRYPTDFRVEVENMLTAADTLLIGIEFNGAVEANVRTLPLVGPNGGGADDVTTEYQRLDSFEEVRNSSGLTYWQDVAGNRVWVKLRGGTWVGDGTPFAPDSDALIYQTIHLEID